MHLGALEIGIILFAIIFVFGIGKLPEAITKLIKAVKRKEE
jgi:Sec-independent protein translocase protein TatA